LQSINEGYCLTSKEELQSINAELQTINSELKAKLEDASRSHSDIQDLMDATDVDILFLDTQLRIKRFTPRIADLFNIVAGDVGRSIADFTHSLDYEYLAKDARSVLHDLVSSEREVRSRNGAWYLLRMRTYRTVENKIDGVVVTLVNIGELRRAEGALRDSEARLRAVFDGVGEAIITISDKGLVVASNKATAAIFGYSTEELIGRDLTSLIPEPHDFVRGGDLNRYQRTGQAKMIGTSTEVEGRRKDGSAFPMEFAVSEIQYGDERLFIGFVRDLSERRRFEARLSRLHSNRLDSMADMAGSLAHEINQPLAAASNYLSVARQLLRGQKVTPPPAVEEALDKASSQMLRAGAIVAHLREFMTRGEPDKIEHSLHDLIGLTCELMRPSAKEANVEIVLQLNAPEDEVLADRVQIEQALVNLMRNAIEAMGQSRVRRLTIATLVETGTLRTDIADTGRGLSESVGSELFVPFTSTKSNGRGVGLSISRSIIEAHYGTIWAEPNPGGGARFCFTLPLARFESAER
jgi:two-component system, chemotaxis family, CheB/CheR fusion protein